ncbi:hypothetical protein ACLOJK_033577 [Asimina triloba]
MWMPSNWKSGDVESGARPLYPMMLESPELRWAFIRKVYSILSFQLLVTVAVAATVVSVRPIANFFVSSPEGLGLYILIIFLPFITLCPLYYYYQRHPINLILLTVFTVSLGFAVGLTCAFTSGLPPSLKWEAFRSVIGWVKEGHIISLHSRKNLLIGEHLEYEIGIGDELHVGSARAPKHTNGKVILESAILTAAVVVSLTIYTFWAARRGYDFNFLGPFLFASTMVLMLFVLIQLFFPMGRLSMMIYGAIAAIIFCGYIIYDTDNLIKRHSYDEYVWAAVALYLDIINLFLSLLTLFRAAES